MYCTSCRQLVDDNIPSSTYRLIILSRADFPSGDLTRWEEVITILTMEDETFQTKNVLKIENTDAAKFQIKPNNNYLLVIMHRCVTK